MVSRVLLALVTVLGLTVLYFFGLSDSGLLGPDEPRYADIGREMWQSGDLVTPRLFGEEWFEKPALLYWLGAVGFALGAGDTLAPRLALPFLAIGFLWFFHERLRMQCGVSAALPATLILATSAGFIGFSHAAVTDLPLTVFFGAGMLLAMPWALGEGRRLLPWAAACFAIASLAKGLVPMVLAAPLLLFGGRRVFDWLRQAPLAAFFLVGVPWYVLCTWRNGWLFIDEFFLEHHVGRFFREDLQHVQPGWFYLPVIAGLLLPWTPLLGTLALPTLRRAGVFWSDRRVHYFLAWAGFGLVFFSASKNKLPGYVLPLLPAIAAILGMALARLPRARFVLSLVAACAALFPIAGGVLPQAIAVGLSRADITLGSFLYTLPALVVAVAVFLCEQRGWRRSALLLLAGLMVVNIGLLKWQALPAIRLEASAISLWKRLEPKASEICIQHVHRATEYGLRYYSHGTIPMCDAEPRPLQLIDGPGGVRILQREDGSIADANP